MIDQINELIDINLNLICETEKKEIFSTKFLDINRKELTSKFNGDKFADEMVSRNLIRKMDSLCIVEEYGLEIYKYGGWKKYVADKIEHEKQLTKKQEEKEVLEINLTKSNLEANKLNKKIAKTNKKNEKRNRISTYINIIIGITNIGLLLWQILKS